MRDPEVETISDRSFASIFDYSTIPQIDGLLYLDSKVVDPDPAPCRNPWGDRHRFDDTWAEIACSLPKAPARPFHNSITL